MRREDREPAHLNPLRPPLSRQALQNLALVLFKTLEAGARRLQEVIAHGREDTLRHTRQRRLQTAAERSRDPPSGGWRIRLVAREPHSDGDGGGQHDAHDMRAQSFGAGRRRPARQPGVQQTAPYI